MCDKLVSNFLNPFKNTCDIIITQEIIYRFYNFICLIFINLNTLSLIQSFFKGFQA